MIHLSEHLFVWAPEWLCSPSTEAFAWTVPPWEKSAPLQHWCPSCSVSSSWLLLKLFAPEFTILSFVVLAWTVWPQCLQTKCCCATQLLLEQEQDLPLTQQEQEAMRGHCSQFGQRGSLSQGYVHVLFREFPWAFLSVLEFSLSVSTILQSH